MSQQQPPSTAPPVSRSQGQEADLLRRSRAASELSFLAASTSLFLDAVAKRGNGQGMQRLAANGQHFTSRVKEMFEDENIRDADLPFRQLVPLRVWKQASNDSPELRALASRLPALLDRALHGQADPAELTSAARVLDDAAERFREQSILMVSPLG